MTKNYYLKLFASLFLLAPFAAFSATLTLEGYRFKQISDYISPSSDKVDLYADGVKVISQKVCTNANPCKVELSKKSVLSLCDSDNITKCKTGIQFDPALSQAQKFSFVDIFNGYSLSPYMIFTPLEASVLNEYLNRQAEAEKQRDEMKNRVPN